MTLVVQFFSIHLLLVVTCVFFSAPKAFALDDAPRSLKVVFEEYVRREKRLDYSLRKFYMSEVSLYFMKDKAKVKNIETADAANWDQVIRQRTTRLSKKKNDEYCRQPTYLASTVVPGSWQATCVRERSQDYLLNSWDEIRQGHFPDSFLLSKDKDGIWRISGELYFLPSQDTFLGMSLKLPHSTYLDKFQKSLAIQYQGPQEKVNQDIFIPSGSFVEVKAPEVLIKPVEIELNKKVEFTDITPKEKP